MITNPLEIFPAFLLKWRRVAYKTGKRRSKREYWFFGSLMLASVISGWAIVNLLFHGSVWSETTLIGRLITAPAWLAERALDESAREMWRRNAEMSRQQGILSRKITQELDPQFKLVSGYVIIASSVAGQFGPFLIYRFCIAVSNWYLYYRLRQLSERLHPIPAGEHRRD